MNKNDIIKIAALVVVVGFITELFFIGGGFTNFNLFASSSKSKNTTGETIFNGTIRTYDPILVLPLNTSQSIVDQLRITDGVLSVQNDPQGIIVRTETRDDVYPLSMMLSQKNITTYSIANIAVTSQVEVATADGKINASIPNGVVRVATEPLLDSDNEVSVYMVAVVSEGVVVDYGSASILLNNIEVLVNATLDSLNFKSYTYSIPWEERNNIGDISKYGKIDYKKVDLIVFKTPLSAEQILIKKQLPYITYIDSDSAQVESDFTNISLLETNFADAPFDLPDSKLVIVTNGTPDVKFNHTIKYQYSLIPKDSGYDFGTLIIDSDKEYEINQTLELNISANGIGSKILSIKHVGLPS